MAEYPNYIVDVNPFKLAGPPEWFKRSLWEFDASLVIVPSRQGFYYRLGQRRQLKLPERVVNDVLKEQADTRMLASHSLVPVTTILATVNWGNPIIFEELRRRAPWRMGGAQKFTEMVEDQDKKEYLEKQEQQEEHLDYLAKDAWKFYNKKIGLRSHLWSPKTKSSSPASSGHGLILPNGLGNYRPEIITSWIEPRSR